MRPVINDPAEQEDETDTDGQHTDTDRTDGEGDSVQTPSQSRSPSVQPEDDSVDVFDGYSFKGRHSVIIDDEEEPSSGEETEEEETSASTPAVPAVEDATSGAAEDVPEEEEPKTPEARPTVLPDVLPVFESVPKEEKIVEVAPIAEPESISEKELPNEKEEEEVKPVTIAEATVATPKSPENIPLPPDEPSPADVVTPVKELPTTPATAKPFLKAEPAPPVKEPTVVQRKSVDAKPVVEKPVVEEPVVEKVITKASSPTAPAPPAKDAVAVVEEHRESLDTVPPMAGKTGTVRNGRNARGKREKSGVAALDRFLSEDENGGNATEQDEDDWDFVEAMPLEERNGTKGNSLFARGVVDRYRLSVFRKGSTPQRLGQRSASGSTATELASPNGVDSPSPSAKKSRGRNPGLTFRRHPKEFLRTKSPASASSSRTRLSAQTLHQSVSQALSTASSTSVGQLTPSSSVAPATVSPSLRNKESTLSVATTPSVGSDQSADSSPHGHDVATTSQAATRANTRDATVRSPEPEAGKNKVLKKYKEGAEKVFALFSSPR
jgi:serum/glucocorticoid-regulated kinase 2